MTHQLNNAMTRELSGDELLMVAGRDTMERDHGRYNAPSPKVDRPKSPRVFKATHQRCETITYDNGTKVTHCYVVPPTKSE
jgi:hypothetical protein